MIQSKIHSLAFLLLTLCTIAFSQSVNKTKQNSSLQLSGNISGTVTDSITGTPVEGANFILFNIKDSTLVNGSATSKDGGFSITNLPVGNYFARLSCVGYKTRRKKLISITKENPEVNLGEIKLSSKEIMTGEVQITAEKNKVQYEDDKIVINVGKNGKGGTAYEFLDNLPMVRIDAGNDISMMGRKNVKVFINGIPASALGFDQVSSLKMLGTYEMEKVELITEPSIEYGNDVEGGVINIVTKNEIDKRLIGYLSGNADTKNKYGSFFSTRYGFGDFSVNGAYSKGYSLDKSSRTSMRQTFFPDTLNLLQSGSGNDKSNKDNYALNLFYRPDKNNSLRLFTSYSDINGNNESNLSNQYLDGREQLIQQSLRNNNTASDRNFKSFTAQYIGLFDQKKKGLSLSFSYLDNMYRSEENQDQLGSSSYNPQAINLYKQRSTSQNTNKSAVFSATYNQTINMANRLIIGYKGRMMKLGMNSDYFNYDDSFWQENTFLKRKQSLSNYTHSLSGSYNFKWRQFDFAVSSFMEYVENSTQEELKNNSFTYKHLGIYPGLKSQMKLGKQLFLSFSYRRGVWYPKNAQLNPQIDFSDSTNLRAGNPELKPAMIDDFNISFKLRQEKFNFILFAGYERQKDIIEPITIVEDRTLKTTYRNVAKNELYKIGPSGSYMLQEWLTMQMYVLYINSLYSGSLVKKNYSSWKSSIDADIDAGDLDFSIDFSYSSATTTAQEKTKPQYSVNARARMNLFSDRLTLSLNAIDLFNTLKNNSDITGAGFNMYNSIRRDTRIIELGITYLFFLTGDDKDKEVDKSIEEYGDDF